MAVRNRSRWVQPCLLSRLQKKETHWGKGRPPELGCGLGRPIVLQPRGDGPPPPPALSRDSKHFRERVLVSLPSFISQEEVLGPRGGPGALPTCWAAACSVPRAESPHLWLGRVQGPPPAAPAVTSPGSRLNSTLSLGQGGRTLARGCPPPDGAHFTHSALSAPPAAVAALRKADGIDCGHGSWARGSGSGISSRAAAGSLSRRRGGK